MKQSFTYSGEAKIRRDAMRKAKKEGVKNFSSLVELLLQAYISGPPLVPSQAANVIKLN